MHRSEDCFQIGWPMRLEHDFFCIDPSSDSKTKKPRQSVRTDEDKKSPNEDEEMEVNFAFHFKCLTSNHNYQLWKMVHV